MSTLLWIAIPVALISAFVFMRRDSAPSLYQLIEGAIANRNLDPLVEHVSETPEGDARGTAANHAIKRLWEAYERPLATQLLVAIAPDIADNTILQYWIKQVMEVEPDLAGEHFDMTFLRTYFDPMVARGCGSGCGCG